MFFRLRDGLAAIKSSPRNTSKNLLVFFATDYPPPPPPPLRLRLKAFLLLFSDDDFITSLYAFLSTRFFLLAMPFHSIPSHSPSPASRSLRLARSFAVPATGQSRAPAVSIRILYLPIHIGSTSTYVYVTYLPVHSYLYRSPRCVSASSTRA